MQNNTFICNKLHHIHLVDTLSKAKNLKFNVILAGVDPHELEEYISVIDNNKLLNLFISIRLETNTKKVLRYDKRKIKIFKEKLGRQKIKNTFFLLILL